jgi:hypothetical protein
MQPCFYPVRGGRGRAIDDNVLDITAIAALRGIVADPTAGVSVPTRHGRS